MRKLAYGLIGLVVIMSGLWLASRALPPTDTEREALTLLSSPPTFEGANAFSTLWLMLYDVPAEEGDAVMAADIDAHRRHHARPWAEGNAVPIVSKAATRYRELRPDEEDRQLFCQSSAGSCLDQVRTDPDRIRQLVLRHSTLLDRIASLADHDYVQNLFPPELLFPTPALQVNLYTKTLHALNFVDGDIDQALEGSCRDLQTWRRLGAHSDTLLMRMIGQAFESRSFAPLLADMLAELPLGHPIPEACLRLAQTAEIDELSICLPMRGEFQFVKATMQNPDFHNDPSADTLSIRWRNRMHSLFFSADASVARVAPHYAQWCGERLKSAAIADDPSPDLLEPKPLISFRCLGNWAGCLLTDLTLTAPSAYHLSHLDYGAYRRALAALIWLQQHGQDIEYGDTFASLPAELQSETRPLHLDLESASIHVELHQVSEHPVFSLPLPGSRFSPVETSATFP
ncbi:MAG: hypothetical protein JJU31_10695 [Wenzhouxiangella sp.]|nr:hypothetical protein [Wenzhouxiangella sp.]